MTMVTTDRSSLSSRRRRSSSNKKQINPKSMKLDRIRPGSSFAAVPLSSSTLSVSLVATVQFVAVALSVSSFFITTTRTTTSAFQIHNQGIKIPRNCQQRNDENVCRWKQTSVQLPSAVSFSPSTRLHGASIDSTSSTTDTDTAAAATTTSSDHIPIYSLSDTFVSQPQQVYIEDTDAYGIVYNSNYLKFYERALLQFHVQSSSATTTTATTTAALDVKNCIIKSFQTQKFRSSPKLGDAYVIHGTRIRRDDPDQDEANNDDDDDIVTASRWNLVMKSVDGKTIYNTLEGVVWCDPYYEDGHQMVGNRLTEDQLKSITKTDNDKISFVYNFTVWKDELNPYHRYYDDVSSSFSSVLPLRSVLNYFERPRSNFLGGPDGLKRLQHDDGIVVVVTSIQDCSLSLTPLPSSSQPQEDSSLSSTPTSISLSSSPPTTTASVSTTIQTGDQIQVHTHYDVRRNGMVIDCYQTVLWNRKDSTQKAVVDEYHDDSDGNTVLLLARGKVTMMLIDANTRRPTKKLPTWLKTKIGL